MAGDRTAEALHGQLTLATFVDQVWAPRVRRRLAAKTLERDRVVYEKHIRRGAAVAAFASRPG